MRNYDFPCRFSSVSSQSGMGILKIAYRAARIFWKITNPVTQGTRTILIKDNRILLVKHSYQDFWYFPGGGVKKGETYEEAALREMNEEAGVQGNSLSLLGVYSNFLEGKNDTVVIFICRDFAAGPDALSGKNLKGLTRVEIEEIRYFPLDDLPDLLSPGCRRRLAEMEKDDFPGYGIW